MSAKARVRLCSGLAKNGWLSKRVFQRIFPKIKSIRINSIDRAGSISGQSIGFVNIGIADKGTDIDCSIPAGSALTVKTKDTSFQGGSWNFTFTFNKKNKTTVAGMFGGFGGDSINAQGSIDSQFLSPLSGGYYYTEALQEAFGLMKSNQNVGTYPNCRHWNKDQT